MMYATPYHSNSLSSYCFLVTGGAGFIGSNLVAYLLQHGAKTVRVLDNFSNGYRENLNEFMAHPAFELIEGEAFAMSPAPSIHHQRISSHLHGELWNFLKTTGVTWLLTGG